MDRRSFLSGAAALALAGCKSANSFGNGAQKGRILLGVCTDAATAPLLKSIGYDFYEWNVGSAFAPDRDDEWWKRQKDVLLAAPLPLRSCNGFIPGSFRLTGPKADHAPALAYAETALRRAEEVGVKTVVFGSGGARNVPGDFSGSHEKWPNLQRGRDQYADFCRELCRRVKDLKTVQVVIEPLCPNESNIINYVWQGVQICEEVDSPRLAQLADIYHMMSGREDAKSIIGAAPWLRHCHIASCPSRQFPGFDPKDADRLRPYFDALRSIGYTGGVSCECGWGDVKDFKRNLTTALETMKGLI